MRGLCEGNGSLLLPVLQASSMLCLAGPLQVRTKAVVPDVWGYDAARLTLISTAVERPQVMDMAVQRFDSAAAADLPAMVLYLIKHATQSTARQVSLACCIADLASLHLLLSDCDSDAPQVAQMMRQKLRFATSADPRCAGVAMLPDSWPP